MSRDPGRFQEVSVEPLLPAVEQGRYWQLGFPGDMGHPQGPFVSPAKCRPLTRHRAPLGSLSRLFIDFREQWGFS